MQEVREGQHHYTFERYTLCAPEGPEVREGKLAWAIGLHATADLSLEVINEFKTLAQSELEQSAQRAGGSARLVAIEKYNRYSETETIAFPT
jgi:hypothetical protein